MYVSRAVSGSAPIAPNGWAITAAEKSRTGIQTLELARTADPASYWLQLVDTKSGLAAADYSSVRVSLTIGSDAGAVSASLVQRNSNWTLA